MLIFSPKSPDEKFNIAILFSVVEKSNNYIFEDDFQQYPGEGPIVYK